MKVKVYLRVAKSRGGSPKVTASAKPNYKPLESGSGWNSKALPTAAFAVVLDIPDTVFERAAQVLAEVEIPESETTVAADVTPKLEEVS